MGVDMWTTWQKSLEAGRLQARVALSKDLAYQSWNARLGGVYTVAGDRPQPPFPLHEPERILETGSGKQLSLINPISMTRQVRELAGEEAGLTATMTSLRPTRPENGPDAWEREALQRFARGEAEVATLETIDGRQYMRVMRPVPVEPACLSCHDSQGYRAGDLGGGLSVRVPMDEMLRLNEHHMVTVYLLYFAVWIVGLAGLGIGARRNKNQMDDRAAVETALQDFKLSLDNIDESVLMFDTNDLELFYCNRGAQNLLGLDEERILNQAFPTFITPEYQHDFYAALGPLFRRQQDSLGLELTLLQDTDTPIPVELHIAYVVPRERADRFLVVLRDISERKNAEREKEIMLAQLLQAQKLESVGQLAAGIAHEINTPTQFVSTNIEFLDEAFTGISETIDKLEGASAAGSLSAAQIHEALDRLDWSYLKEEVPAAIVQTKEGLGRVRSIVSAMKEFSHPGGKTPIPEDLNRIVETTVTVSRNEWKYVAEMTTDLAPDLPLVPCLKDELGQVLLNLIINAAHAVDAREQGDSPTRPGRITVTTRRAGGNAEILVADTGTGIAEAIRSRIFDPFFTTKQVGKGSGQGLAICRDVIEQKHRGRLDFTSEIGRGTTFTIRLPLGGEDSHRG